MNKFLPVLFFVLAFSNFLDAQSQRKVLIEHFTQASCGPCASVNPIITPIIESNLDKLTKITHQVSWPGVDPMNKDNPGDVQNRVNYYGVTGVPDVFLDAYSSGNPTATITEESIANEWLITSPYEIQIINTVLQDYNSIQIDVTVKRTGNVTGNPMLRVAALEKVINWTSPPGNNGEKVFHHVMKKYLPNTNGTPVAEINQIGQSKTYTFIYKFDKLYDFKNLETAAFIQNDATKEVYQSENAPVIYTASPSEDIAIKTANATGVFTDSIICGTRTAPIVKVVNTGNKSITTMEFNYSVNGGATSTYTWNGKLDYLKEVNIILPFITFIPFKGNNSMNIEVSTVNHVADYTPLNNISNLNFYQAPSTTPASTFEIKPGTQPAALSFIIRDDKNAIVLQDGPFSSTATKTYPLTLDADRCYTIYSTNNTASLNGTYKVYDDKNNFIFQQRIIGTGTVDRQFSTLDLSTATENQEGHESFSFTPNPASYSTNFIYESKQSGQVQFQLLNPEGRIVMNESMNIHSGINQFTLDLTHFAKGIYYVSLRESNQIKSGKLVIR
jgi:hypothetical protein